jgi:hypothetical protein
MENTPSPVQTSSPDKTTITPLQWALIGLGIIIVIGLGIFAWSRRNEPATQEQVQATTTQPSGSVLSGTDTNTTTIEIPTEGDIVYVLGQTASVLEGDVISVVDPKDANRGVQVETKNFTDSRCQEGVQCVWAGERGVNLSVTNKQTGEKMDVYLGTERAKTADAFGFKFTLVDIEDGKGGPYAEFKVE